MKKTILTFVAIVILVNAGITQEKAVYDNSKLYLGVKAGANLSNVYDAQGDQFNANSKIGFVAGGFLSIPIGKYLGIQPEVLFSQKGFEATGSVLGYHYNFTRTTNFIDVPLLVQFKPIEMLTILAGPQYSYLLKQTDVFQDASSSEDFKNDNIRKNILCFLGGIDINMSNLVLGGRVGWDVQTNNGDGTSSTPRYKNVWYQATVGFRF